MKKNNIYILLLILIILILSASSCSSDNTETSGTNQDVSLKDAADKDNETNDKDENNTTNPNKDDDENAKKEQASKEIKIENTLTYLYLNNKFGDGQYLINLKTEMLSETESTTENTTEKETPDILTIQVTSKNNNFALDVFSDIRKMRYLYLNSNTYILKRDRKEFFEIDEKKVVEHIKRYYSEQPYNIVKSVNRNTFNSKSLDKFIAKGNIKIKGVEYYAEEFENSGSVIRYCYINNELEYLVIYHDDKTKSELEVANIFFNVLDYAFDIPKNYTRLDLTQ